MYEQLPVHYVYEQIIIIYEQYQYEQLPVH